MTVVVEMAIVVLSVFIAVGMLLLTIRMRELLEMLGAINNAVERVAVVLKKR